MSLPGALLAMVAREGSGEGEQRIAHGWLDPAEPFLADHQPGGQPLLGTVGGLEVLAATIAAVKPLAASVALEAVEAIRPVVIEGDEPRRVTARWSAQGGGSACRIAAALSTDGDDGETIHVRCVFVAGTPDANPLPAESPKFTDDAVTAGEIYDVFFHGPTFRVVARAQLRGEVMASQLASSLPRWAASPGPTHIAPRLIEFGLQTAGLLQLALDGAMMIPRHIDRVERYLSTDVDDPAPLFAIARRAGTDPADPIDIRIIDASGTVHLAITGYRCVKLPFATDNARLTALADRLRASDQGIRS